MTSEAESTDLAQVKADVEAALGVSDLEVYEAGGLLAFERPGHGPHRMFARLYEQYPDQITENVKAAIGG